MESLPSSATPPFPFPQLPSFPLFPNAFHHLSAPLSAPLLPHLLLELGAPLIQLGLGNTVSSTSGSWEEPQMKSMTGETSTCTI